ncbi:MAG: ribonuclease HII [bacterium]|nr:ribonuclease HII [bacterium]
MFPDFSFEKLFWDKKCLVIGVDEVGRGALAGPIYAGAICFYPEEAEKIQKLKIKDCKALSPVQRIQTSKTIYEYTSAFCISSISTDVINKKGISYANREALKLAVRGLLDKIKPKEKKIIVLVDGYPVPDLETLGVTQVSILQGDSKSISIASASVIAKVARDTYMITLHEEFPMYAWKENKGYGTKRHLEGLKKHKSCKYHRTLFIRKALS